MDFLYTSLATVIISLVIFLFSFQVGKMRGKHDVKAPATTGHAEFERAFRVHMNSLEQVIIFLPVLWIFAAFVGDMYAAIGASFWVLGRILYSMGYMKDPSKRSMGFMIGFLAFVVMLLWSLVVLVMNIM